MMSLSVIWLTMEVNSYRFCGKNTGKFSTEKKYRADAATSLLGPSARKKIDGRRSMR